jgi:hypothetical protein
VSTYIARDVEIDVDAIEAALGNGFVFGEGPEFEGAGLWFGSAFEMGSGLLVGEELFCAGIKYARPEEQPGRAT